MFRKSHGNFFNNEKPLEPPEIEHLANRWRDCPDTAGKRHVHHLINLYYAGNQTAKAVIENNPILFKETAIEDTLLAWWLEAACLCRASDVAHSILEMEKVDLKNPNNVVGYAASTGDHVFVVDIAATVKAKGGNAGGLFLYANDYGLIQKIKSIFSENVFIADSTNHAQKSV